MLRITIAKSTASSNELQLAGRITGSWVEDLRRVCNELLVADGQSHLTLDLSDVSFIDNEGIALLRQLVDGNAVITNYSPFLAELLKEVVPCSWPPVPHN